MQETTSKSSWRPLQVSTFRDLLTASFISDSGAFMQSVGAAWLMLSFGAGPMYVALTQTASSLAFFILALPAGSIGDIRDRRKLIMFTAAWMIGVGIWRRTRLSLKLCREAGENALLVTGNYSGV